MGPPPINWEHLARSQVNPVRLEALEVFAANPGDEFSAKALSDRLEKPLANVAYHVKVLREAGMIVKTSTHPRRGAIETRYKLAP